MPRPFDDPQADECISARSAFVSHGERAAVRGEVLFCRKAFGFAWCLLFCAASLLLIPASHAGEITSGEKAKIEALISNVEALNSATFLRNGSEYDAKSAAKFLRGKWQAHAKEVATAEDFISKVATKSSTTGKAYVIRFKGGAETPCADYLTGQLKKQVARPPGN